MCGRAHADCHLDTITIVDTSEARMSKYRSRERVYRDINGVRTLVYPVGAPIPEDEARRQGVLGAETAAIVEDDVEDKAIRPGVTMPVKPSRGRGPRASTK